jgi:hypothetical protein
LPGPNPYEVLKVPRNASTQAIEDAYDRLFDQYEPRALAGDRSAIETLNALNEARDVLIDPKSRAALDRSLAQSGTKDEKPALNEVKGRRTKEDERRSRPGADRPPAVAARASSYAVRPPTTVRTRPRARYSDVRPQRSIATMMPFFIVIAFLLIALLIAGTYLLNRGPAAGPGGDVVATVNGQPIYRADYEAQAEIDKTNALNDPLYGALFNNFQGITGTRALDTLKFDSLDKLINMQVILQQAKKEGLYPTESQIDGMVEQAKQADLASGQTFESFLQQHNITAERYRRAVAENTIYTVMADQHMPKEGDADQRTEGFIQWICNTRKYYDVKILIDFLVKDNPSCTSGLPSNMPLPGLDQTAVPEPEGTVAPELTPDAQSTPQAP